MESPTRLDVLNAGVKQNKWLQRFTFLTRIF